MMKPTLDVALLQSVAAQMMYETEVKVRCKTLPVGRTSVRRLKTVTFKMGGREYQAIQQNPEKPSRWGKLARAGHQVVQAVPPELKGRVIEWHWDSIANFIKRVDSKRSLLDKLFS